mmetsp:Transcript_18597/g.23131  ORF Transcript_18597/g.23131 Transcript_18597/m.23131 type:complete len:88 (+) Transcript_18597:488-751(+)|eukprot:CAMPEP_0170456088 /NCGR_PEP_ID=MMETSP0123-20130129/3840_1 /TAXON_ID=182087 /ORGANISM="Favella ehrenbergii, Strain Fehren 1" /LENGTH=87 /DNA_ID=CAMNT_0010719451 /DNA_START=383 /DNA_END=646 /DNA_ORIENTATION=+
MAMMVSPDFRHEFDARCQDTTLTVTNENLYLYDKNDNELNFVLNGLEYVQSSDSEELKKFKVRSPLLWDVNKTEKRGSETTEEVGQL